MQHSYTGGQLIKINKVVANKPKVNATRSYREASYRLLLKVTHGEDLCKHSHESLMGRIYARRNLHNFVITA